LIFKKRRTKKDKDKINAWKKTLKMVY
jgi:hypothetical protein